jgi:septum site-determining protein MinD
MTTSSQDISISNAKHSIAIVSGKGGSGKTIILSVMAEILDILNKEVLLLDTDVGTSGMTFYMGLKLVKRTGIGLADIVQRVSSKDEAVNSIEEFPSGSVQPIEEWRNSNFIGTGNIRKIWNSIGE